MKKLLITVICTCIFINFSTAQKDMKSPPLAKIAEIINASLIEAKPSIDKYNVLLTGAQVTLKTTFNKQAGGGFKIIAKGNYNISSEKINIITYSYKLPKDSCIVKNIEDVCEELKSSIEKAAMEFGSNLTQVSGLEKESFSVEVSFAVSVNKGGGVEFEIFGIGLDLSGDIDKAAVHKIKLTFIRKEQDK